MVMQFRFAIVRNLVRKKSTSRTFNTLFEGYVDSGNLHTPERVNARFKNAAPQLRKHPSIMYSGMLLSGSKPSLQTQMAPRGLRP